MTTQSRDPRTIITPDAFSVDPPLLGIPLATPMRRAAALLIDLIIVALITALTSGFWFVFGVAVAASLFLGARKPREGKGATKQFRLLLGCMGFGVLSLTTLIFIAIVVLSSDDRGTILDAWVGDEEGQVTLPGGLDDVLGGLVDGAQIMTADTPEQVVQRATSLGLRLVSTMDMDLDEVEDALAEVMPNRVEGVDGSELLEQVMVNLRSSAGADFVDEAGAPDAAAVRAEAMLIVADTIEQLEDRLERAQRDRDAAREDLQQEQERGGLFAWFAQRIESLGFGLGWWTMYFALLMPWMKGQTPGKRVMGIRVVRLDGQPVNWWHAFERAGGYAAGLATGTLGFAQVYWDPNRQAIHDKIAGTVVILDGAQRLPGRWDLAEGGTAYVMTEEPGDESG